MQGLIWLDRAAAWPLWGYFSYVALFSGVLFGGLMWLGTPEMGGLGGLGAGAFFGVFFGACMTAWVAIVRRRDRAVTGSLSRFDRVELNRAARAGEPPADPALDQAALALIERRRGQVRSAKASPWIFGAMALIGVVETVSTHSVVSFCLTVADIGLIIVTRVSTARQTARLDLLERAIRERSADGTPSISGDAVGSSPPSDVRRLGTRGARLTSILAIWEAGLVLAAVGGEELRHDRADSEVDGSHGAFPAPVAAALPLHSVHPVGAIPNGSPVYHGLDI